MLYSNCFFSILLYSLFPIVCVRAQDPRHTPAAYDIHIRRRHLCDCLWLGLEFPTFKQSKTKRTVSLFYHVVLRPSAPPSSDDIAAMRADADAKIWIKIDNGAIKANFYTYFNSREGASVTTLWNHSLRARIRESFWKQGVRVYKVDINVWFTVCLRPCTLVGVRVWGCYRRVAL